MDRLVYLDTCCVIYFLEDVQPFSALIRQHLANNLDAILCVSALVRLESLVKPSIDGNQALIEDYENFSGRPAMASHRRQRIFQRIKLKNQT